jgi:hypothetical protein
MEQLFTLTVMCLILLTYYSRPSEQNNAIAYNIPDPGNLLEMFLSLLLLFLNLISFFL